MGKGSQAAAKKEQQKKENRTPKTPGKAPEVKTENKPKVETEEKVEDAQVIQAAAMNPGKILSNKHRGGLSPDATVQALDLAHRVFVEEKDPDLQFPKETAIKVNKIVAIGILCTLADHGANGDDSFATVLNTQAYPGLAAAAEDLGFKIPDIKALPAGKDEGTIVLPADKVNVPAETKKKLQEEKKIREAEKPELDPEKITSEEDLKKALEYMFITQSGRRLTGTLIDGINFMKKFRLHESSLAENADEAKAKFENYNSGDWLDDLFSYVQPSVFFTGIGRGMANVTMVEKNPIHAFIIFRDAIKDKETGNPVLSDQELAYCVKSIIKWYCNTNIESNKKAIEAFDAKKNAKDIEACNVRIADLENIIGFITNPSDEVVASLLDNIGSKFNSDGSTLTPECAHANTIFNTVCKSYYNKALSTCDYKNLDVNVQQYAGCIINLFREAGTDIKTYSMSNISDLEERSEEEKEALAKEAKKAWAAAKEAEKKKSEKNA